MNDLKIYFAGKVDKNDWRHEIAPGLRRHTVDESKPENIVSSMPLETAFPSILYNGPYVINCDHGCYHGPTTHGCGSEEGTCTQEDLTRDEIMATCVSLIYKSDAVYAWIDSTDCYGTLAEIGFAKGIGKPVFINTKKDDALKELWFACHLADALNWADDPMTGFKDYVQRGLFGEVLERYAQQKREASEATQHILDPMVGSGKIH